MLKGESDDIVAVVKKNGVPVEYIVFDDEGHGFRKKTNQIAAYGAILHETPTGTDMWLARHLPTSKTERKGIAIGSDRRGRTCTQ